MESKKKLLIADADESFRSILMDTMRDEADMEVLAATGDGEEALRLVRELSPDVLLMDMVLSRMDGLEVLSAGTGVPAQGPGPLRLCAGQYGRAGRRQGSQLFYDEAL